MTSLLLLSVKYSVLQRTGNLSFLWGVVLLIWTVLTWLLFLCNTLHRRSFFYRATSLTSLYSVKALPSLSWWGCMTCFPAAFHVSMISLNEKKALFHQMCAIPLRWNIECFGSQPIFSVNPLGTNLRLSPQSHRPVQILSINPNQGDETRSFSLCSIRRLLLHGLLRDRRSSKLLSFCNNFRRWSDRSEFMVWAPLRLISALAHAARPGLKWGLRGA